MRCIDWIDADERAEAAANGIEPGESGYLSDECFAAWGSKGSGNKAYMRGGRLDGQLQRVNNLINNFIVCQHVGEYDPDFELALQEVIDNQELGTTTITFHGRTVERWLYSGFRRRCAHAEQLPLG